jgi:hypothetical protein
MPTSTPGAIWNWTGPPKACGPLGPTGPNGTTAKAMIAAMIEITGARM